MTKAICTSCGGIHPSYEFGLNSKSCILNCDKCGRQMHKPAIDPVNDHFEGQDLTLDLWCDACELVTAHEYLGHAIFGGVFWPTYACQGTRDGDVCYHEKALVPGTMVRPGMYIENVALLTSVPPSQKKQSRNWLSEILYFLTRF